MKKHIIILFLILHSALNGICQPFIKDIERFREIDELDPPPQNAILFIGSSSFTMWYDLQEQFPDYIIINRAFGGSTLEDQIRYVNDIVFPHNPKQIVIYCGENDFASSDLISVDIVFQRFVHLYNLIFDKYPEIKIAYVSMKPSPSRWHLAGKFIQGNRAIEQFLETKPYTNFIDVWEKMINSNSIPDSSIFLDDMLHMNQEGYKIWQNAIKPHLIK